MPLREQSRIQGGEPASTGEADGAVPAGYRLVGRSGPDVPLPTPDQWVRFTRWSNGETVNPPRPPGRWHQPEGPHLWNQGCYDILEPLVPLSPPGEQRPKDLVTTTATEDGGSAGKTPGLTLTDETGTGCMPGPAAHAADCATGEGASPSEARGQRATAERPSSSPVIPPGEGAEAPCPLCGPTNSCGLFPGYVPPPVAPPGEGAVPVCKACESGCNGEGQ